MFRRAALCTTSPRTACLPHWLNRLPSTHRGFSRPTERRWGTDLDLCPGEDQVFEGILRLALSWDDVLGSNPIIGFRI